MEGVLPFLEAFYRDFYFPDQQTQGQEMDETDHLAKACVVSARSQRLTHSEPAGKCRNQWANLESLASSYQMVNPKFLGNPASSG